MELIELIEVNDRVEIISSIDEDYEDTIGMFGTVIETDFEDENDYTHLILIDNRYEFWYSEDDLILEDVGSIVYNKFLKDLTK